MGLLRTAVKQIALVAERPAPGTIAAAIPVGMSGIPQIPPHSYERNSLEGYMRNELVFACIECRATSAAEPRLVAWRGDEKITEHPIIDLWERPNLFTDRYTMTAGMIMFRDIGGNAFLEKVRARTGKVVELWQMRPDRVRVIPDERTYIGGYEYRWGTSVFTLPQRDVIHYKTRHPRDEYYGLPPLAAAAGRTDLDNWSRDFVRAFFQNAGVPAGLVNIKQSIDVQQREMMRARFRQEYGGPQGWHNLMIIDGGEASYTAMGMPLGERGLVVPELDEINEARICMVYAVPHSIAMTRLGAHTGSYANRVADERWFWDGTLVPLYTELGALLTRELVTSEKGINPDVDDIDRIGFDLEQVKALQEDADELHARLREDMKAGGISREEFRVKAGYPREIDDADTFFLPSGALPSLGADVLTPALPEPQEGDPNSPDYGRPDQQAEPGGSADQEE